jgi:DNA-binding CsgD family transcriptional regulator
MLITGLRIPEITDRPETLLFDWEDFDVAGGLDGLADVIATRQRFETERDNLTPESSRREVERVLECSPRQANRVLQRLRGGKVRVTFREQILALLADGEKTTPEFAAAIQGHPKAINTELTRLVDRGEIVKVKRGLYRLPKL